MLQRGSKPPVPPGGSGAELCGSTPLLVVLRWSKRVSFVFVVVRNKQMPWTNYLHGSCAFQASTQLWRAQHAVWAQRIVTHVSAFVFRIKRFRCIELFFGSQAVLESRKTTLWNSAKNHYSEICHRYGFGLLCAVSRVSFYIHGNQTAEYLCVWTYLFQLCPAVVFGTKKVLLYHRTTPLWPSTVSPVQKEATYWEDEAHILSATARRHKTWIFCKKITFARTLFLSRHWSEVADWKQNE